MSGDLATDALDIGDTFQRAGGIVPWEITQWVTGRKAWMLTSGEGDNLLATTAELLDKSKWTRVRVP